MNFSWKYVVFATSAISALGGLSMALFVPDGPFRKSNQQLNPNAFFSGFRNKNFRAAAFGYFGHMWELYTFWAFIPVMLSVYKNYYQTDLNVALLSFAIIASGGLACILSGYLSQRLGVKRIATISLCLSCFCCFVSPLFLLSSSVSALISFLFFWGLVVIADSPLFSTLVAQNAPEESRGTALTIVNCIGFSVTIISIQFINLLSKNISAQYLYTLLAVGPIAGLTALLKKNKEGTP